MMLEGRTCVFAGATGNIGKGAVKALAQGGMNVVMVTHNQKSAESIIDECMHMPGKVTAISNANGDAAALASAWQLYGSVDVVINSTGGMDRVCQLQDITSEELNRKLSHQVTDVFMMAKEAIPYLKNSSAGRIIFVSSLGAQDGFAGENMADSIARGGVISLTYCLARELARYGITVNCIARGGMINDHAPQRPSDYDSSALIGDIPVGRLGTADEFGALVSYLASEEAAFMTGQVLALSGGLHIG